MRPLGVRNPAVMPRHQLISVLKLRDRIATTCHNVLCANITGCFILEIPGSRDEKNWFPLPPYFISLSRVLDGFGTYWSLMSAIFDSMHCEIRSRYARRPRDTLSFEAHQLCGDEDGLGAFFEKITVY